MNDPTIGITLQIIWDKLEEMDKRLRKIEAFNAPSEESLEATRKLIEQQRRGSR